MTRNGEGSQGRRKATVKKTRPQDMSGLGGWKKKRKYGRQGGVVTDRRPHSLSCSKLIIADDDDNAPQMSCIYLVQDAQRSLLIPRPY